MDDHAPHNLPILLPIRRSPFKLVPPFLLDFLVGFEEVAEHVCTVFGDDAHVHIRSGTKIVENTGLDGFGDKRYGCVTLSRSVRTGVNSHGENHWEETHRQASTPLRLEDRHSS
jgi:hypothetical protein